MLGHKNFSLRKILFLNKKIMVSRHFVKRSETIIEIVIRNHLSKTLFYFMLFQAIELSPH